MTAALDDAPIAGGWAGTWFASSRTSGSIASGPRRPTTSASSGDMHSTTRPPVGGCQQQVLQGDDVLYTFDFFGKPLLRLEAPQRAVVGVPAR